MGLFGNKSKAQSTIPKEFINKGIRPAINQAAAANLDPFGTIRRGQRQLGITPGVRPDRALLEGLATTRSALPQVNQLFGAGGRQQAGTIAGNFLDPTQVPAFQNLISALNTTGQNTFQQFLDQARQNAARSGAFRSSAREGQEATGAQAISSNIAEQLARAGTDIFNRERGLQEQAAAGGLNALPQLANQLFGQGQNLTNVQLQDLASRLQSALGIQDITFRGPGELSNIAAKTGGQVSQTPSAATQVIGGIGSLLQPASLFGK